MNKNEFARSFGPGLLFASTAIGVTHFVLCTTAGALYGLQFLGIVVLSLILKYPFFEFSSRYAATTGKTLLHAYREQSKWAFYFYLILQLSSMFTVTGAVAAVCAGLLGTVFGIPDIYVTWVAGAILLFTFGILVKGQFKLLDKAIKIITVILFVAVIITFISVLIKGAPPHSANFIPPNFFDKAGLVLLVGIIGWMPNGLEASIYNSIWIAEKRKVTGYQGQLREVLLDFKIGYGVTAILAILFIVIGAMSVYGTGHSLDGGPVQFTQKLITIFTSTLGPWSFYIIAITAFAAIYGTLLAAWDVFARTWIFGLKMIKFGEVRNDEEQSVFQHKFYPLTLGMIGVFGFVIIQWFGSSLGALLKLATVISFLVAPLIAILNVKAILNADIEAALKPSRLLMMIAYLGIVFVTGLAGYFLYLQYS